MTTFNWTDAEPNNGLPQQRLVYGDYEARVYNACGDGMWCGLLNQRGERGVLDENGERVPGTLELAKARIEQRIREDVERRIAEARKVLDLYGRTEETVTVAVTLPVKLARLVPDVAAVAAHAERAEAGDADAEGGAASIPVLEAVVGEMLDEAEKNGNLRFSRDVGGAIIANNLCDDVQKAVFERVAEAVQ